MEIKDCVAEGPPDGMVGEERLSRDGEGLRCRFFSGKGLSEVPAAEAQKGDKGWLVRESLMHQDFGTSRLHSGGSILSADSDCEYSGKKLRSLARPSLLPLYCGRRCQPAVSQRNRRRLVLPIRWRV